MENAAYYAQQYPLAIAAVIVVLLLLCWRDRKTRRRVAQLTALALAVAAVYFLSQKFIHYLPSSQAPRATSDENQPSEEHAGHKYYRDPEKDMQE